MLQTTAVAQPGSAGRRIPRIARKQRRREQPTSSEDLYPDQPTAGVEVVVDCTVLDLKVNHLGSGRETRFP